MFLVMWQSEAGRGHRNCETLDGVFTVLNGLGVQVPADQLRDALAHGVWRRTVEISGVPLTVSVRR